MAETPLLRFIEAKSIEFAAEPTSFSQNLQKSALFWSANQFDVFFSFPRFSDAQDLEDPTPLIDVMTQFVEAGGSLLFEPSLISGIPQFRPFLIERIPISLQKSDLVIPVCHEGFNRSQIMLQAVKAVLRAHFDMTQIEPISVLFVTRFLVMLVDVPWQRERI